jgi:hypothetical protein
VLAAGLAEVQRQGRWCELEASRLLPGDVVRPSQCQKGSQREPYSKGAPDLSVDIRPSGAYGESRGTPGIDPVREIAQVAHKISPGDLT